MGATPKEASFVDVVEGLLQTPIFYDEARTILLHTQPELLNDEELGARRELGSAAIRLIAWSRTQERVVAKHRQPNFDVKQWNAENCLDTIKMSQLGAIAFTLPREVRHLARQMALINMGEEFLESNEAKEIISDLHEAGYGDQEVYFVDTIQSIRAGSLKMSVDNGREVANLRGATVVAPTGYGKTWLMGLVSRAFGVGKPIRGIVNDTDPVRMLISEPTQELVDQIASEAGDKTFERASGLRPGRYFEHDKNKSTAAVATTNHKIIDEFREDELGDEPIDLLEIDEVHLLTSPKLLACIRDNWRGMTFGFTATPDYDALKDVRRILPTVIQHDSIQTGIEKGVLNGAQLFSLYITANDRHGRPRLLTPSEVDQKVVAFLKPLIEEGRRGLVVCDPGNQSHNAKKFAARLRGLKHSDGTHVRAQAIGNFDRKSSCTIRDYHEGKLDVLTTVSKGIVGLSGEFDFVYAHCSVISLLRFIQIVGRGTRLSDRFPFTIYAQSIVPKRESAAKDRRLTIYEAFGLEEVEQGLILGPTAGLSEKALSGAAAGYQKQTSNSHQQKADYPETLDLRRYSREIREMLDPINHRQVGEVFIVQGREIEVPKNYISLSALIDGKDLTRKNAIARLAASGLDWVGEKKRPNQRYAERWYEPASESFFDGTAPKDPVKELSRAERTASIAAGEETTRSEAFTKSYRSVTSIATEYNISWQTAKKFVDGSGVPTTTRQHNHLDGFFIKRGVDEARVIAKIEEEIPFVESGEKTRNELLEEFGIKEETAIFSNIIKRHSDIKTKRRRLRDKSGTALVYDAEQVEFLKQEITRYLSHPIAEPQSMTQSDLLSELGDGWSRKKLRSRLSLLDHELSKERWIENSRGSLVLRPTWTRAEGLAVVGRLRSGEKRSLHSGRSKSKDHLSVVSLADENPDQVVSLAGIAEMLGTTTENALNYLTPHHRRLALFVGGAKDSKEGQFVWTLEAAGEVVGEILAKRYGRQAKE